MELKSLTLKVKVAHSPTESSRKDRNTRQTPGPQTDVKQEDTAPCSPRSYVKSQILGVWHVYCCYEVRRFEMAKGQALFESVCPLYFRQSTCLYLEQCLGSRD